MPVYRVIHRRNPFEASRAADEAGERAARSAPACAAYSGPAALDLSRHWHRAEGQGERRIAASFAPGETRERLEAAWLAVARATPRRTVRRHLAARLPGRLFVSEP